jgi:RNA polymerase sigma-70 factor, ECF subfamily
VTSPRATGPPPPNGSEPSRRGTTGSSSSPQYQGLVAGRICLDLLGSARAVRERYVGEWLPEPLPEPTEWTRGRPADATADPADRITLDESIDVGG